MNFVTIDFETANHYLDSACSLGIVKVEKGKIVFQKEYLINPECIFEPGNILIHGITPGDVASAPKFYEIWDEIYPLINGEIVFAHAADFDIKVLKAMIEKYNLKVPEIKIGCTLKIARIALKENLPNCKLNTISAYIGCEHNHHNALSDAIVCYYLIKYVERIYQVYDVVDLFNKLSLVFGVYNSLEYSGVKNRLRLKTSKVITNVLKGQVVAFTGKPKNMTKKHFMNLVSSYGGIVSKDYNYRIDIFVVFPNPTLSKVKLIKDLRKNKDIKMLSESEFMELINNDQ